MRKRVLSAAVCCGLALSLLSAASSAGTARTPRLLINAGRTFQVRPATIVVGMVAITGSKVSAQALRAGHYGHIHWLRWSGKAIGHGRAWVPDGPRGVRPFPAAVRAWRVKGRAIHPLVVGVRVGQQSLPGVGQADPLRRQL